MLAHIIGAILFSSCEYNKVIMELQIALLLTKEKINDIYKQVETVEENSWKLKKNNNNKFKKNIFKDKRKIINMKQKGKSKELSASSSSRSILKNSINEIALENKSIIDTIISKKIRNKELFKQRDEIRELLIKTDNELNCLNYKDALIFDKRNFCSYYISLIRNHQILIFTIHSKNDYNSRIIKICYFFFIYALVFIINLLFIDDSTLYFIRINDGFIENIKFNFAKIIFATVISYLLKVILSYLIFSENIFLNIKNKMYRSKRIIGNLGMKYVAYFGVVIISFLFFIYYSMCFFAVFPNIQKFVLEISIISFSFLLIIPMVINIFPCIFRIYSLGNNKDRELSYRFSQFLQMI